MQFTFHPNVYNTNPRSKGLLDLLEQVWIKDRKAGVGVNFIISGFSNYNGGVRFYEIFKEHIDKGGKCIVILGGSTSQRLSSIQVVEQLLEIGCEVHLINRKRLLHAKCYGFISDVDQGVVISSGNFTGPGMSQNIEASLLLRGKHVDELNFSWEELRKSIFSQSWDIYSPTLAKRLDPAWSLLYDESRFKVPFENEQEVTMLLTLVHSDTARIQANRKTKESRGSQYFWVSKESFDFFPALTIKNKRGIKPTYSTIIRMNYVDLGVIDNKCRVTFEAGNNLDFRLGTGKLRYSKLAKPGDLAAITRISEYEYELRVFTKASDTYNKLNHYAINLIGNEGKKYGYIPNDEFFKALAKN
ncbi:phospholipase D-like domain-containing protein [Pontibacter ruber]|uniref:Phospholipase D-like domain-containing protein n=1 Tax=Pontibacter ruber TaxID=1343895 RepID=A0ABW5CX80_9BACT|nr:phospholipase D-like domain-containing protein [Pontibacter ruber]